MRQLLMMAGAGGVLSWAVTIRDIREHLPRHRDLGQLEGGVAATLAPILISFSRRLVSDHATLGIASVRMKLPRL
jgi:hypothetical protein